jgi:hypothetical protein
MLKPVNLKIQKLVEYMEDNPYCTITIVIQNGEPVFIERITERIKL